MANISKEKDKIVGGEGEDVKTLNPGLCNISADFGAEGGNHLQHFKIYRQSKCELNLFKVL